MLQFGASLADDTSSVNYDRNMFIIQATELMPTTASLINAWCKNASNFVIPKYNSLYKMIWRQSPNSVVTESANLQGGFSRE